MHISPFQLERYFARHEFSAKYLLSSSDCDGLRMEELLEMANNEERQLWNDLTLGYTESQGHPLLRESMKHFYDIDSIQKILVASPGELNYILMNALLAEGDHVIAIRPSYQSLHEVPACLGCKISYWEPDPANWKFGVDQLEKLMQSDTKLIIINFPHNPTGSYLTKEELLRVVEIAKIHDAYLFSDEMYHKLIIGKQEEVPPASNLYEKGISLWGTSKSFGLAGLRIGWMVTQDLDLMQRMQIFKDYLSICSSAPSEILSLIALNHAEQIIQRNVAKIKGNVELFEDFVGQHQLFENFITPVAGSTGFVKLNIEENSINFCNSLVKETGIMIVPGEMFNYPGNFVRIGFGRELFAEGLEKLAAFLLKH